ncbi:phytanoyl-CoA dioxygenase family protein [Myxococcus sp. RHSTA-1-4]|uniref:phytanoyl-CoA dioxygenase family protein n=1 Tax=Myxococcus sp. RHSTA-1-4 TaxID=2874601 RepID=UPI001CBE3D84|nr:phytanoyl-CoA dioxygenase family protein [Myxococcus sp. RHSTA-1-4]MBZ4416182.1 phytanoyl-CoA dioxygenase family protein [Myxococcus sp. RHSTA-1-4]
MGLSDSQVEQFIEDGFVRLDCAFPRELADEVRELLWRDTGCSPDDPATWTRPVVRLGEYAQEPFRRAANTPRLHAAFDQLVGPGRWLPRASLGSFPVRFPSSESPGDDGWHVDASFPGEDPSSFFSWRVNVTSRGRALLMLFLFSDVSEDDAPTRIRVGSHREVARLLEPEGEAGLSFMELAGKLHVTEACPLALATGEAGTVYLCHPFIVHAAQPHRGTRPRFMAQPPLFPSRPFHLQREDGAASPVELAIQRALKR